MLRQAIKTLKKIPIDFGQYEVRYTTKGKLIALDLVRNGTGKKALDLGCRDGFWSEKLIGKGYNVTSVDLEPCYSKGIRVNADLPLPFADHDFDLVWCSEVIEHLTDPGFSVAEMKRVLKPAGELLLTTPNRDFWFFKGFEKLGIPSSRIQNEEHQHFFTYSELERLVGDCEEYGFFPYVLYKCKIKKLASFLSPTIVVHYHNAN